METEKSEMAICSENRIGETLYKFWLFNLEKAVVMVVGVLIDLCNGTTRKKINKCGDHIAGQRAF